MDDQTLTELIANVNEGTRFHSIASELLSARKVVERAKRHDVSNHPDCHCAYCVGLLIKVREYDRVVKGEE